LGEFDDDARRSVDSSMAFPRVEPRALFWDQVSFALALRELGVLGRLLPTEWNYPTYSPTLPDVSPQILHYSRHFKPPFRLRKTGVPSPDRAIETLNARIEDFLAAHSMRWVTNPDNVGWKKQVLDFFRGGSPTTSI
jgi:hypothetical protein